MGEARRMISLGFTSERFREGCHMCYIYNDEEERREVIARYLESGFTEGESVTYLVDTMTPEAMCSYLAKMGIPLPPDVDDKQFSVLPANTVYCAGGTFVPDRMLENLCNMYDEAIKYGYAGSRVSGEMTWALQGIPGSERLIEYEAGVNIVVREHPITAICQYNANLFDGGTIFKVLNVHPMMVVRGQIVKNPYYIPPEEYLARNTVKN